LHGHYTCSYTEICCPLGENICPKECQAYVNFFTRLISLWSSILCPINVFLTFDHKSYLLGERTNCGVKSLKICLVKLNSSRLVTWWKFNYVIVGKTNDNHDKKISRVEILKQNQVISKVTWSQNCKNLSHTILFPSLMFMFCCLTQYCLVLILPKTMHLKFKMRSKICTNSHFRLPSLCISHLGSTLIMI
jgi:hypothetical protein